MIQPYRYKSMNSDCYDYYDKINHCVLVKETPTAIRIKLENHPERICIWMPKSVVRSFTGQTGWFWSKMLRENIYKEESRLLNERKKLLEGLMKNKERNLKHEKKQ